MKFSSLCISFILVMGVSSCTHLGPVALPPDRLEFNRSLSNSDEQQNLLNIVRLRYTDSPYFLSVNSVVSQFTFDSNASTSVANSTLPALLGSGNVGFGYTEAPTITYTPLQGEDFINRLLTPVDLSVLYMLFRSGWTVHHVSRIMIQRFGDVENASLASRAISGRIPVYKPFLDLVAAFRHLQDDDNVWINKDNVNGEFAIKVGIKNYALLNAKDRAIFAKYDVTADSPTLWLISGTPSAKNQVYIETRTVLGILNYLSKGVDVPAYDVVNKQVRMTWYPDGTLFDWHNVTKDMIHIRTSTSKPSNAYCAVAYRGSWFYISQDDFGSKESIHLLEIIMGIYQGNIKANLPVFTVS